MDFEIEEMEDGQMAFVADDGSYVDVSIVSMIFELHRQNPEFYEHWIALANNYLFVGPVVGEA